MENIDTFFREKKLGRDTLRQGHYSTKNLFEGREATGRGAILPLSFKPSVEGRGPTIFLSSPVFALTGPGLMRTLKAMNGKTTFVTAGLFWELLRFIMLFLFLGGCAGISLGEGNFFLLLWGLAGFPFTLFLWIILPRETQSSWWISQLLAVGRVPSLIILGVGMLGFFFDLLPGRGRDIILQNEIFSEGRGFYVLLFILLLDFLFFIKLLLWRRKEV